MGFPERERFTLADVARRWDKPVSDIKELVRTLQFTHIIVVGELIDESPLTRHLYFDRALWIQGWGKPERRKIERKEQKRNKIFADHQAKSWKETFGTEMPFEPILKNAREECVYRTAYNIGPNEVANLWDPYSPQQEWTRPKESVQVYIPRSAVEAFEQKHGLQNEANAQQVEKKDKRPLPDISEVLRKELYTTSRAAKFVGVTQKHLQNDRSLKERLGGKKIGSRWYFPGQNIRDYREQSDSKS